MAFAPALSLGPVCHVLRSGSSFVCQEPTRHRVQARPRSRAAPTMIGPLPGFDAGSMGGGGSFFKSEIVRNEIETFMNQQAMLGKLGQSYRTFDREGKVRYIDESLALIDKWLILLQRFKLSDEFQCQLYVKQLETHLQSMGMTTDMMAKSARQSLELMRDDANRE